ncbi:MAG TPA: sigma 54-interacting transcriptional regulator [Polyangiaceae bacterium]|nr:sigma 54-interacting transcriptional regulator [Polyangiaceae bacterium]
MIKQGTVLQHRYEILHPLGKGASSSALLARDLLRNDLVTLKLLHSHDPALTAALRQEFAILVGRFHPHLPLVRDLEKQADHLFYTADFIDGTPLTPWAQSRSAHDILTPLAHILDALHFLHRLGIRHGDIKPDNILVTPQGQGVLIDLGCARPLKATLDTISGTLGFMAPELLEGGPVDIRADLFAFGITCSIVLPTPAPELSNLLQRLIDPNPDHRPSDAAEVNEAFGFPPFTLGPPQGRLERIVGRQAPLKSFQEALSALRQRAPHPRCLVFHGPDGVGRSRLLNEMKWQAQLEGAVIQGDARAPRAIEDMFARALGSSAIDRQGLSAIVQTRHELAQRSQPVVLVLDDIHLLASDQRELLDAWLRLLEPTDPWLLLLTSRHEPTLKNQEITTYSLGPLDASGVLAWTQGLLSPAVVPHVLRLTGGYPADLEALMDRVLRGEIPESDLPHASAPQSAGGLFLSLPKEEKLVLGWLAVAMCDDATLRSCCQTTSHVLLRLHQRGWIEREGRHWKLQRGWIAPRILASIDRETVTSIHRWHAEKSADNPPMRAYHFACGAESFQAGQLLLEYASLIEQSPQAWRPVTDALEEAVSGGERVPPEVQVACAQVNRLCGRFEQALRWIARCLRSRPGVSVRIACRMEAALCFLASGRLQRAETAINTALFLAEKPDVKACLLETRCRIAIQQGNYEHVLTNGKIGLHLTSEASTRAKLHASMGLACTYLGQMEQAVEHLEKANTANPDALTPREKVRLSSFSAILAYRQGDLPRAIDGYRQASRWAEEHGLGDQMVSTAMNLGTAQQQAGEWGNALASYERGLLIARAIGKGNTACTLTLNLANLYAGIGVYDRARTLLSTLRNTRDLGYVEANRLALEAELFEAEGLIDKAMTGYERAERLFSQQGAQREVAEMCWHQASLLLQQGNHAQADSLRQSLFQTLSDISAPDLTARWHALSPRSLLGRHPAQALSHAQQALISAAASKQSALDAEMQTLMADIYEQQGASQLACDHRLQARRAWESMAVGLPESFRPAFWAHPRRSAHRPEPSLKAAPPTPRELLRILEINRRLNSSLATHDVLSFALDAAIELSGAERGFLLVRSKPNSKQLDVAVARNLDKERIGRSHLKFSRSIAENVVKTGLPVTTTDALTDDRFRSHQSVHAMRLRSVVCVPVTTPQGVLGAIYLDHRFRKDQFDEDMLHLLGAFADQVAIALRNARLVEDLERRTEALQKEQERVQQLLEGQAATIEKLSSEVQTRQQALEHRYDYSSIIGTSAPMQAVFHTLDRVTDMNIDVLVQGESGTGKELVARALHFNGPRRQGPFLSINCAALPESLLESELFGVVKGAFTGAHTDRKGLLVSACGGTLFLDEIGEMPLGMQAKLLRVLQERRVRPLGSSQEIPIDIRLVSATNRHLLDEISAGRFREDLYYRIAVVEVRLPPLRERPEDIPALCHHILHQAASSLGKQAATLRPEALRALLRHPLPGNVRQLDNLLRRAWVLAEGNAIGLADLDLFPAMSVDSKSKPRDRKAFEQEERAKILAHLESKRWNISEVARAIAMPRNTLYRKLLKYGLHRPQNGAQSE